MGGEVVGVFSISVGIPHQPNLLPQGEGTRSRDDWHTLDPSVQKWRLDRDVMIVCPEREIRKGGLNT